MKELTILFLLIISSFCSVARQNDRYFVDEYGNPQHYDISNPWSRKSLIMLVDGGARRVEPFRRFGDDASTFGNFTYLEGASWIELETIIHKDSLTRYRYSIIENGEKYLVRDATPKKVKFVWNERSDIPNHLTMDLGKIDVVNKKIEVVLRNLSQPAYAINRAVIYNKQINPASILLTRIVTKNGTKFNAVPLKDGDTIINDANTLGLDLAIRSTDINSIYEVVVENKQSKSSYRTSSSWKFDGKDKAIFNLEAGFFKTPGQYHIQITPRVGSMWNKENWVTNEKTVKLHFTVKKSEERTFGTKEFILMGLTIAAILGAIFGASIAYLKKKNQKKLINAQQQKDVSKAQLNSIRAQLNPHFMFNALAGIQNLMNQTKIDEANHYLGKFARLTRNVLEQGDLVSLTQERELLQDYLQMEQLRFDFTYEIKIHQEINMNTEIPAMLLQPFVENAVKHGIPSKQSEGNIAISFVSKGRDLVLTVIDNGVGFVTGEAHSGFGLQLSKNRISLLNTIYQETPIVLDIESNVKGTTIAIILTQWL